MAKAQVHFEIQGRRGTSWTIIELMYDADKAKEEAEKRFKSSAFPAIRVIREKFDPNDNNYSTMEMLYLGKKIKASKYDETGPQMPCWKPADLYSYEGRRTITDLLGKDLERWQISATELLHSVDYYFRLVDMGTSMQNAVQRASVAQVKEVDQSVQERMKDIFNIIDQAADRLKDSKDSIPDLKSDSLSELKKSLEKNEDRSFIMTSAIVKHFAKANHVQDKLARLLKMIRLDDPQYVLRIADNMVSEYLAHATTLMDAIGHHKNLSEALKTIAFLVHGKIHDLENPPKITPEIEAMNVFFSSGKFLNSRTMLIGRVAKELKSSHKLIEGTLLEEFEALADLTRTLRGDNADSSIDLVLLEAAKKRGARYLNNQFISEFLEPCKTPAEEIEYLFDLANVVEGEDNLQKIANFALPITLNSENEVYFKAVDGAYIKRMRDLAHTQRKVLTSSMTETYKKKIAEKLDEFCTGSLEKGKIFLRIKKTSASPALAGQQLMQMIANGYFAEGQCVIKARKEARRYLHLPNYLESCIVGNTDMERAKSLMGVKDLLIKSGMADQM